MYIPKRGNIVWLNFDPQIGREHIGRRPALVLSHETYNTRVGLMLCCPITSRVKGYPFEVTLPKDLPIEGVVLADQVKSSDWRERKADFICQLSEEVLDEVILKINSLIKPKKKSK